MLPFNEHINFRNGAGTFSCHMQFFMPRRVTFILIFQWGRPRRERGEAAGRGEDGDGSAEPRAAMEGTSYSVPSEAASSNDALGEEGSDEAVTDAKTVADATRQSSSEGAESTSSTAATFSERG